MTVGVRGILLGLAETRKQFLARAILSQKKGYEGENKDKNVCKKGVWQNPGHTKDVKDVPELLRLN